MKTINNKIANIVFPLAALTMILVSCERELSDDVVPATFPTTAEIFTDNPVGLTDQFFNSFDPAVGANTEGFGTDETTFYQGTSSIRIDVPSPSDPDGNFIGGIFEDRGEGRDLTGYDALTFWAKGTVPGTILVGFGTDFQTDTYPVSTNIQLTNGWKQYVLPIPDPSKLTQERGMFLFSAGSYDILGNDDVLDGDSFNDNLGFTFWIDELKFEKLGNTRLLSATFLDGFDITRDTFTDDSLFLNGFSSTFNLSNGRNITLTTSSNYFDITSTNESVVSSNIQVNESGVPFLTVGDVGEAVVNAKLVNTIADGSYSVTSNGPFPVPPTPMQLPGDVISIFSDAYTNVVSPNFTPGFGGSTTVAVASSINGNNIVRYINNNFTGIMFDGTPFDASSMNRFHVDVFVEDGATSIGFQIRDIGANGMIETNQFTGQPEGDDRDQRFTVSGLTPNQWNSIDIVVGGGLSSQRNNIGAIILTDGPNFILDNIYFYAQ